MIRIALADDHKMFAMGIKGLLEEEDDFEVRAIFHNGKDLVEYIQKNHVDIILTDMNMPKLDGMGVISIIKKKQPRSKIIVLSMYDDPLIYEKAIKAGADAYVLKGSDPDELIYTVREVFEGSYILDYKRVEFQNEPDGYPDHFKEKFKLSRRETEILRLIKDGKMNKEIAELLSLSQHTVESHRKKIHSKLGVSTAVELVKKALEMKI
ncbi:two-component response regulator [Indibacter alkaliphilus LW1]|jgi:DNA-binding NarL/FixJ family response regulator|uniref:Two-component response regulator n=1 Tax=Indibacter alkaliphilus (strain CCUG 57479 / KCTC 22604 / LW1) TaxID=1189612 RepID=S2E1J2_INDAL|nr:response regulator transcription factor [Indibacter alkaliphilus]EOZ95953.1 two-component response regulator [Indibacter alkaliphilus LW1]